MTVLSHQTIRNLCTGNRPLIADLEPDRLRTAGYDLRFGGEFVLSHGRARVPVEVSQFGSLSKSVEVPPNGVIIARIHETLSVPDDLVGHLSLKVDVLLQGIIMASQSQIDAGYKGPIFVLLYNLSARPVNFKHLQPVLRIEFATLDHRTEKPYGGDFGPGTTLADVVRAAGVTSALGDLQSKVKKGVRRMKKERRWAVAVVVGVFVGLSGLAYPTLNRAIDATSEVNVQKAKVCRLEYLVEEVRKAQGLPPASPAPPSNCP